MNKCLNCKNKTKNPKFCNRNCSTIFNNKLRRASKKMSFCIVCNKEFELKRHKNINICSHKCYAVNPNKDKSPWKNCGGYRENAGGNYQHGWYKGYYCSSSWELAFVIYNIENNITFKRNTQGFDYTFKNNIHKFYPDFIVNEQFIEIKGFFREKDYEKIKQFPHNILVICKTKIKPYIKYCVDKYGKNYINLYDNN